MKKLLLFSFFISTITAVTSCTADAVTNTVPSQTINADDTGGQSGLLTPPPPPPTKKP
ncbi:hypothetical protein [Flavobacterium sp.]